MMIFSLALALSLANSGQVESTRDLRTFPDLLDSLQPNVEDFRCEYEGTIHDLDQSLKDMHHLQADGLFETFSGVFTWKANGDTVYDAFRRREPSKKLLRETMIVKGQEAEHYSQLEDAPLGGAEVDDARFTNPDRSESLGSIFLIDTIKRNLASGFHVALLEDTTFDGRACSVLTFRQKSTGKLHQRYWIDLKRGGQTFLREGYQDDQLASRSTIELSRFVVGGAPAWMPVGGLVEGYVTHPSKQKPEFHKLPVFTRKIYVVAGTLEFNRHPAPSTFSANYKPGTPVTDHLKQFQYEFGQQKPVKHTRAEAESQLREQLAIAESQKTELAASSPARNRDWSSLLAWAFAGCALITSVLVLISRRR